MAQTAPTKGNLNSAKRSRALAETGYELMDRKRNILIREIMGLIDEAEDLQARIDRTFSEAYASMRLAEISMGGSAERGADAVPIDDSFSLRFRSVMGVELPRVESEPQLPSGPPYGLAFTSSDLDDAYFKFAEVKELICELAQTENSIYRLAYAIKKRRNAQTLCKTSSSPASIPRSPASPTRSRKRSARSSFGSRWSRAASRRRTCDQHKNWRRTQ